MLGIFVKASVDNTDLNIDKIKALSSLASTSTLGGDVNSVDFISDNNANIIINNDNSILDNKINSMVNNKRIINNSNNDININNDINNNDIENKSNYYFNGNSYSCCEKITKGCMKGIVTHHPGRYLRIETYNYTIKQYWTCCHRKKRAGPGCVPGPHPNPFGLNDPICENFLCTVKLQNDENERKKIKFQKRNIDSNNDNNDNNNNDGNANTRKKTINDDENIDNNNNKNKKGIFGGTSDFIPKESNDLKNFKISKKESWRNLDNNNNNNNNNSNNNNSNINDNYKKNDNYTSHYNNLCYDKKLLSNLNDDSYSDTSGNSSSTSISVYRGNKENLSISLPITPPLYFSKIEKNSSAPPSAQISPRYKNYKKKVEFDFDKERKKEYLM